MLVVSSCSSIALSNVKKLNIIKVLQEKKKDPQTLSQGLMVSVLHQHDQNLSWSC